MSIFVIFVLKTIFRTWCALIFYVFLSQYHWRENGILLKTPLKSFVIKIFRIFEKIAKKFSKICFIDEDLRFCDFGPVTWKQKKHIWGLPLNKDPHAKDFMLTAGSKSWNIRFTGYIRFLRKLECNPDNFGINKTNTSSFYKAITIIFDR